MFDWYAFADYSGAREAAAQRKAIAWAVEQGQGISVTQGLTRQGLLHAALALLESADQAGKRVIFGFDHNYGFPMGFSEALWGMPPADWEAVLGSYWESVERFAGWGGAADYRKAGDRSPWLERWSPREWARAANAKIADSLGTGAGPFWGSRFGPKPAAELFQKYGLPSGGREFMLHDRRLAEARYSRLKPGYQLGGIGSVGQQTLYGILYLRELLRLCRQKGVAVHVWPQDGCRIPEASHVAVEVYPTLALVREGIQGPRSDAGDAAASVRWLSRIVAGTCGILSHTLRKKGDSPGSDG